MHAPALRRLHPCLIPIVPHTIDDGALRFIPGPAPRDDIGFNPLRYLASNLDVARAYGTDEARGLDHWLSKGYMENRYTASFSAEQYLSNYADLRAAFGTDTRAATLHWIQTGAAEGRNGDFSPYVGTSSGTISILYYVPIQTIPTPLPL